MKHWKTLTFLSLAGCLVLGTANRARAGTMTTIFADDFSNGIVTSSDNGTPLNTSDDAPGYWVASSSKGGQNPSETGSVITMPLGTGAYGSSSIVGQQVTNDFNFFDKTLTITVTNINFGTPDTVGRRVRIGLSGSTLGFSDKNDQLLLEVFNLPNYDYGYVTLHGTVNGTAFAQFGPLHPTNLYYKIGRAHV